MKLTPTSHVILGMLGLRPMCGYEIKRFVDKSTRFFWAASYGQIYPELARLSAAGLIAGDRDPGSARRRIVFRLTADGRKALREWLAGAAEIQETRDESLLKVFFSDLAGPGGPGRALEAKRRHHAEVAARLRAIESAGAEDAGRSIYATLRYGIAVNEFAAEWCRREAEALGTDSVAEGAV